MQWLIHIFGRPRKLHLNLGHCEISELYRKQLELQRVGEFFPHNHEPQPIRYVNYTSNNPSCMFMLRSLHWYFYQDILYSKLPLQKPNKESSQMKGNCKNRVIYTSSKPLSIHSYYIFVMLS